MKALLRLSFDAAPGRLWVGDGCRLVEEALCHFPLAFLSTDFAALAARLEDYRTYIGRPQETEQLLSSIRRDLAAIHPFFELSTQPVQLETEKLQWLYIWMMRMEKLKGEVAELVDGVFLPCSEKRSAMQRLCMLQMERRDLAARFSGLGGQLQVEQVAYVDGWEFALTLSSERKIPVPKRITKRLILGSDDILTILLTILERMAAQNMVLKKCEYCGQYFQPFSIRTIYCDRLVGETGKSCKELAAREKYENKIARDEGLSLYQRRNKAYAMRVARAPQAYSSEEYRDWKGRAETRVKEYERGEISLEQLEQCLKLPKRAKSSSAS